MTIHNRFLRWMMAFLLCVSPSLALAGPQSNEVTQCIAFIDVNVIPMNSDTLLDHQTVLIFGDRIGQVGPLSLVKVPANATVIDGRSRYLMPGLTDFHVHFPDSDQDQLDELKLLVRNGITTAVNMRGTPKILALRNQLRLGKIFGPTLYSTGPYVNEPEFTTPEQVTRAVITQKAAGYDFIKIHGELSAEAYQALIETARQQQIRVVGHVPANLGIDAVLGKQAMIVHAEEYLYSYFQRSRDLPTDPAEIDRMVKDVAEKTARSGTWFSATLAVFREIIFQVSDIDAVLQRPEMRYLPPDVAATWQPGENVYVKRWPLDRVPYFRAQYAILRKLTKGMNDAGVPLLVGTDPFVTGVVPGFAMQDELDDLVGAGLTPYQVLHAATANAATFLGTSNHAGTVQEGKQADLLLLEANPLEDITNVSRRAGVMLHGHWITEDRLQQDLTKIATSYRK
jgi:imidazolonepropionase-like amidohydrolase